MVGTAVTCRIDTSTDLEDVFLYFAGRLGSFWPASVAEAQVTDQELDCLTRWFSDLVGKPRNWCDDPWQTRRGDFGTASNQQMFGALLVILAGEVCRRKADEEELWPAVARVLQVDERTYPALFASSRQPSSLFKKAVSAGVRRLNLRNLVDCPDRLEYADTIRLQFGFTRRGASKRLPEWLDGQGRPVAVKILLGEEAEFSTLKSKSFSKLWDTLRRFRRELIEREYAASVVSSSPWSRPEWANELLDLCRQHTTRTCFVSSAGKEGDSFVEPDSAVDADSSPGSICELRLQWEQGSKPRLCLLLDKDRVTEILTGKQKAAFAVDGRPVGTWVATRNGEWHGDNPVPCQPERSPANLRPGFLAISGDGDLMEEVDLAGIGIDEPLLIFDLRKGRLLGPSTRLDPNRAYAVVCDSDFSIPGAAIHIPFRGGSVFRLEAPWPEDLVALCGGMPYCRLSLAGPEPGRGPKIALESLPGEPVIPDLDCHLSVTGVPEIAKNVSVTVGSVTRSADRDRGGWRARVRITPELALRRKRLRVRISGDGFSRAVIPKVRLAIRAMLCAEPGEEEDAELRWEFVRGDRPLNRAGGSGSARILVNGPENGSDTQLYEGWRRVSAIRNRLFPLRELQAWGAPLIVRTPDAEFQLVAAVEDRGMGRFQPPLFAARTAPAFRWRAPLLPENDHEILVWPDLCGTLKRVTKAQIFCEKDGLIWKFPSCGTPAAMAVAYRGERIASFWNVDSISRAVRSCASADLFAILRWLHAPVLGKGLIEPMKQATARMPVEFIQGWMGDRYLPHDLVQRTAEDGLESVVREFLWDFAERDQSKLQRVALAISQAVVNPGESDLDRFRLGLLRLSGVCPVLAYSFAYVKARGDKYKRCVRSVAASLLNLPPEASTEEIEAAQDRICRQMAALAAIEPEALVDAAMALGRRAGNSASAYGPSLRRLAETDRGCGFIAAALLLRVADGGPF